MSIACTLQLLIETDSSPTKGQGKKRLPEIFNYYGSRGACIR